jgi:hypothetical protein
MEKSEEPSAGKNSKAKAEPLGESGPYSISRLFRSVVEFAELMPTVIKLTISHACVSGYVTFEGEFEGEGAIVCPSCGRRFVANEPKEPDPVVIPSGPESDVEPGMAPDSIVVTSSPGLSGTSSLEPSGGREPVAVPIESHEVVAALVVSELVPAIASSASPRTRQNLRVADPRPFLSTGHLTGMRTKLPSEGPRRRPAVSEPDYRGSSGQSLALKPIEAGVEYCVLNRPGVPCQPLVRAYCRARFVCPRISR